MGKKVKVSGDGWGDGEGEYIGTVTESDDQTHTIIYETSPGVYEETLVLRRYCTVCPIQDESKKRQRC